MRYKSETGYRALAAGMVAAVGIWAAPASAAIQTGVFNFADNTSDFAAAPGGLSYVSGNLRVFATAFNYTLDNPLTPAPVVGGASQIDIHKQQNLGLGACDTTSDVDCRGNDNLLDVTGAPELILFQFFDNTTNAPIQASVSTIDFNNSNTGENFDAWVDNSPWLTVFDDALVNHTPGESSINGNTAVNLGPMFQFAVGIDNCLANPDPDADGCGNTDQVRIGGFAYSYDDGVSPVPLPAAAWLLLGGLGALGAMARRRRAA